MFGTRAGGRAFPWAAARATRMQYLAGSEASRHRCTRPVTEAHQPAACGRRKIRITHRRNAKLLSWDPTIPQQRVPVHTDEVCEGAVRAALACRSADCEA